MNEPAAEIIPFPQRPGLEPALTARQLSEALGMSERWIAYQVKAGMPSVRYGRARRFKLSAVEGWLQRKATG